MSKSCENCKYYVVMSCCHNWCKHEKHFGANVPDFTSCLDYKPKETKTTLLRKETE